MNNDHNEFMWLDEHHEVSLDEIIQLSGLTHDELHRLVENGALIPNNPTDDSWRFNSHYLVSILTLSRLKHDFELESDSLALTLVFLERIRTLEVQLQRSQHTNSAPTIDE
ncbi:MAG: hypothetical protein K8Q92_01650 [Methylophilales bacterium]|nr:hypothetical protein [Methylophilales bacterium]